jgi:acyl carrier protein
MNKEQFLQELGEIMMLEEQLELSTELETLDAYDSMTHLTLLGIFEDEFGKEIESKDLIELKTVGDLVALAGLE